ncbi:MAG: hypothetical protein ABI596_03205 [Pyrinomonadaceae bacterium]
MFRVVRIPFQVNGSRLFLFAVATLILLLPSHLAAQRPRAASAPASPPVGEDGPSFSEFKGVRIGMTMEECRKKLGNPKDKSDEQDFYMFGDKMAAQVLYKTNKVVTISIDFIDGSSDAPSPKQVIGDDLQPKPDGSMFKKVDYPKAGYWVSYNRTAGDSPSVSITMQKIAQ